MANVMRLGERAARSQIPILLLGESGSGKEVIARAVHGSSDRAGKPFVAVNCGAIPENLVEFILFGVPLKSAAACRYKPRVRLHELL